MMRGAEWEIRGDGKRGWSKTHQVDYIGASACGLVIPVAADEFNVRDPRELPDPCLRCWTPAIVQREIEATPAQLQEAS